MGFVGLELEVVNVHEFLSTLDHRGVLLKTEFAMELVDGDSPDLLFGIEQLAEQPVLETFEMNRVLARTTADFSRKIKVLCLRLEADATRHRVDHLDRLVGGIIRGEKLVLFLSVFLVFQTDGSNPDDLTADSEDGVIFEEVLRGPGLDGLEGRARLSDSEPETVEGIRKIFDKKLLERSPVFK